MPVWFFFIHCKFFPIFTFSNTVSTLIEVASSESSSRWQKLRICSFASPGSFSIYSSAFQRRDLLSSRYPTCFDYSLIGLSAYVRYLSPFISLLFPSKRQGNLSSSIRSVFGLLSSFVQALPFHKFLQPFLRALEVFDTFHVEFYESSYGGVFQFILNHVCVYH